MTIHIVVHCFLPAFSECGLWNVEYSPMISEFRIPNSTFRIRSIPGPSFDSTVPAEPLVAAAEDLLDALLLVWGEVRADDLASRPAEVLCYLLRVVALHQGEDRRVAGLYRVGHFRYNIFRLAEIFLVVRR